MARANQELISALRRTAQRLATDVSYQWGHMGMCNCGHLAQSITGLAHAEIHASALVREGDWEQQANDYCTTSGNLIDFEEQFAARGSQLAVDDISSANCELRTANSS